VQYMTSPVKTGSISVSVSGIGQVLSSNELDLKAKASGELTFLDISNGKVVAKDTVIAKVDDITARRKVRDASADLENTKLSMTKLIEPPTALEVERAETEITKAKNSLEQLTFDYQSDYQDIEDAIEDLENDLPVKYAEAFNNIINVFITLPNILADMSKVMDGHDYSQSQTNLVFYSNYLKNTSQIVAQKTKVENAHRLARESYDTALQMYQATSRDETEKLVELTDKTYKAADDISQALKELNVYLTLVYDEQVKKSYGTLNFLSGYIDTITGDMSKVNPHLTTIFDDIQEIADLKKGVVDNQAELGYLTSKYKLNKSDQELAIKEKEDNLKELKAGAEELDIKEKQLQIEQKQNALSDAWLDLKDYTIAMPFDGVISSVEAKVGDVVTSSTILGKAVSSNKMAVITLNEIDIVKVSLGQKAVLTFDAIDDFTLTGQVIEMDTVGTVEQGVVNYDVNISFDVDDERIRPGMSVNANLITESKQDTLLVPNSAVKSQGGRVYVEVMEGGRPVQKPVETGIINDTTTEILGGLDGTETVITNTISQSNGSNGTNGVTNGAANRAPSAGNVMRMIR
jgi:RND family efflux transporter MFP subunit